MATLATLEEAKLHLRIDHDALDDEIAMMLEATTAVIFDYLKRDILAYTDSAGDLFNIKPNWRFACLVWLSILFEDQDDGTEVGQIPKKVSRLLYIDRILTAKSTSGLRRFRRGGWGYRSCGCEDGDA